MWVLSVVLLLSPLAPGITTPSWSLTSAPFLHLCLQHRESLPTNVSGHCLLHTVGVKFWWLHLQSLKCFTCIDLGSCVFFFLTAASPNAPKLGPVELTVVITVPVCLLSVAAALTIWACQGRQCTRRKKKRQNVEEALSECNLVNAGKTLKDLIYDVTASGSGSGMCPWFISQWGSSYFKINKNIFSNRKRPNVMNSIM